MLLTTVLLIIVALVLLGALPVWPHSRSWGFGGSGVMGFVLFIMVVAMMLGWI
jgi:hypothetical protein